MADLIMRIVAKLSSIRRVVPDCDFSPLDEMAGELSAPSSNKHVDDHQDFTSAQSKKETFRNTRKFSVHEIPNADKLKPKQTATAL